MEMEQEWELIDDDIEPINEIYDHALLINLSRIPEQKPLYKCRYMFQYLLYDLCIYPDGACIHQYTANETSPWDFKPVAMGVRDALRKAYIVYALCNGKGLVIKKITIFCDGRKVSKADHKTPGFPYSFSMLGNRQLARDDEMQGAEGVFGSKVCMEYFSRSKRSNDQNDKKIIALFSFLQGRSREYEADRFLNYWTGINAIYGCLCIAHANQVRKKLKEIPDEVLEKYQISREELTEFFIPFTSRNDLEQINVFRNLIMADAGIKKEKSKDRSKGKEDLLREINNDYSNPYRLFAEKYLDDAGNLRYCFDKLYANVISGSAPEEISFSDQDEKEAYQKLTEWGVRTAGSLYAFLSVDEPYYMRNYYIHGSEAPLLVSDSYHLELLSCLNFFMDKLLVRYIPALFEDTGRQRLIDKVHGIIYAMEKPKKPELAKKVNKMAKELGQKDHAWMMGQAF